MGFFVLYIIKQITSDEQNFSMHFLFCTVVKVGWYSALAFQNKSVWYFQRKGGDGILSWGLGIFFPLDVISKYSYWYLKALFLLCIVLHMFILLSRGKVEWPIEIAVQKLCQLPAYNKAGIGLSHFVTYSQSRVRLISTFHFQGPFSCLLLSILTGGAFSPSCKTPLAAW